MKNTRHATLDARRPVPHPSRLRASALKSLSSRALLSSPWRPPHGRNHGFTLFELLAVLTLISIGLVVLVGSYPSWGTAHAVSGATRVLEAGLTQARILAMTQTRYVGFQYESTAATNGFQLFLCTNETGAVAAGLDRLHGGQPLTESESATLFENLGVTPAAPFQRLSGHIRLAYQVDNIPSDLQDSGLLFFRPDGSARSAGDTRSHTVYVYTKSLFDKVPLVRLVRVDLASGLTTVIKPEALP